jgi:epoxide hydrolase
MSEKITPFSLDIPEADLDDLRRRLALTSLSKPLLGPVEVPVACSIFPKEVIRPSRRRAEKQFADLRYWSEPAKGGHFAAFEQPAAFVDEVRAAFRAFR